MKMENFLKEKERIEKRSTEEQKAFYRQVLEEETEKSAIRLQAYFYYARLFYLEGDFRRTREILEPFTINHQSYSYIPEMISCFNLMGVASHCEEEFRLTRYFYERALQIAEENKETYYFAFEYNNITLTYIAEQKFDRALQMIEMAEKYLPECDEEMGAYVYLNKALIFQNLNRLEEADQAFHMSADQYHSREIIPDDVLVTGISIFYKMGKREQYETYRDKILNRLDRMHAAEFIDACKAVFDCALDEKDYETVDRIIARMDRYMQKYPHEIKVGIRVEEYKYIYAGKKEDVAAMLKAKEQRDAYFRQVVAVSEQQRVQAFDQFLKNSRNLNDAIESAAQANRVKTQFLANMSHDMRTPINGIMGMLDIIKRNREDAARVDDCLEKIDASANHLLLLVNDVLDMTKLETESVSLEHEPFELDEICAETMGIVTFQAKEAGLHVYEEHDDVRGVHLLGSALHLKKILINLFSNSMKYNKPGGDIYTSMHILDRTDEVITCEFQIRDTGVGMTEEFVKNKLFEPFIQGADAARSSYAGTGLGMSIVSQLVKKMGGSIEVESRLGEGSCFTVVLPFEIDHAPEKQKAQEKEYADLRGLRILVVEDNELNLEIAEFILTEEGIEVESAENGQKAVEYYQQSEEGYYDGILMDLMMPVMDGYEAVRRIRSMKRKDAGSIPIIAMSANAFAEDVAACLEAGMNAHLSKPLFREEMVAAIGKFCL